MPLEYTPSMKRIRNQLNAQCNLCPKGCYSIRGSDGNDGDVFGSTYAVQVAVDDWERMYCMMLST